MPFGFVSYDTKADKTVRDFLKRVGKVTNDLTPYLVTIAEELRQSRKAIFKLKSRGAYPDFKGPKIAESWSTGALARPDKRTRDGSKTAYQYAKGKNYGFEYPLLRATGDLEKSVTTANGDHIALIRNKRSLEFGTAIDYGNYHQQDSPNLGSNKMPLRKFLFIGSDETKSGLTRGLQRLMKAGNITLFRELGMSQAEAVKEANKVRYDS